MDNVNFGVVSGRSLPTFVGLAWKNGERVLSPVVRAYIYSHDCTGPGVIIPPGDPAAFRITVATAELLSGCGVPGKTISFTINGEPANETILWQRNFQSSGAPTNFKTLDLTIGATFALFAPDVFSASGQRIDGPPWPTVEAFINGNSCGRVDNANGPGAVLVVPSTDLKPGCGFEGAKIVFAVDGAIVNETATWRASTRGDPVRLTAIVPPISTPLAKAAAPTAASAVLPPTVGEAGLK